MGALRAGEHLEAGGEREMEIRGCSIWAVEVREYVGGGCSTWQWRRGEGGALHGSDDSLFPFLAYQAENV